MKRFRTIITAAIAALLQARCERLTDSPEKVAFFETLPEYDKELVTNKKAKTKTKHLFACKQEVPPTSLI